MFVVIVTLDVLPDRLAEFRDAIRVNAIASLRDEPGCLRFDVLSSADDPARYVLYEIYTDEDAFYRQHRATAHYARWREAAATLVRPGGHVNTFCVPAFPDDIPEGPR